MTAPTSEAGKATGTAKANQAQSRKRERVFSGIKPSGSSTLGNYIGAIRHWAADQDRYDNIFCVVDLHAITVPQDPDHLRRRTREAVAELLAMGLDPQRCSLFVQSHVPEHAELCWVLSCLTGFGEASRMTQFKDKSAKQGADRVSIGLFTYPVLQVADILLYQAEQVPVGEDQRQHLELTRDLAQRFNGRYGPTFTVPRPYVPTGAQARIADLADPAKKMSKSLPPAGTLYVLDAPAALTKKIRSAVTDTGREVAAGPDKPGVTNLLGILSTLTGTALPALEASFTGRGYGDLKREVAQAVVEFVEPVQRRYAELLADPGELDALLVAGAARAREAAAATLATVRDRVGFLPAGA